jgi:ribosomal protein S24E
MKVISEVKNKLLERKEVVASLENNSSPTRIFFAEKLAEHFSTPIEQVVVNHITNNFGSKTFMVDSFVYDNIDAKTRYTRVKVKKEVQK